MTQTPRACALTDKGRDLYPVLVTLREWGDRYLADETSVARIHRHAGCGVPVHPVLRCDDGHIVDDHSEIETRSVAG
ncbi:MAG: transcriptional regulator, HxlR family [Ilumatobacteraceae bacterium]|nr:transcriptional regulator, HxlR family [Ilumatobacteraceae bacterium]